MGVRTSLGVLRERVTDLVRPGREFDPDSLARRIERELEKGARRLRDATYAPNLYRIRLNQDDRAALGSLEEMLREQLAGFLRAVIRRRGYRTTTPEIAVEIIADPKLRPNEAVVECLMVRALPPGAGVCRA